MDAEGDDGIAGRGAGRAGSPGVGRLLVMRAGAAVSLASATGGRVGSATGAAAGAGGGAGAAAGWATTGAAGASTTAAGVSTTGAGAGAGAGAVTASGAAGTSALGAAANFAAAFLTGFGESASASASPAGTAVGSATAAFFADFLTGLASSGCSGRVRPSRSARRRRRSPCASMSVEEWLFTPTPITSHRDIISAFVIPSCFASSCTRMFFAKTRFSLSSLPVRRSLLRRSVILPCWWPRHRIRSAVHAPVGGACPDALFVSMPGRTPCGGRRCENMPSSTAMHLGRPRCG